MVENFHLDCNVYALGDREDAKWRIQYNCLLCMRKGANDIFYDIKAQTNWLIIRLSKNFVNALTAFMMRNINTTTHVNRSKFVCGRFTLVVNQHDCDIFGFLPPWLHKSSRACTTCNNGVWISRYKNHVLLRFSQFFS